MPNTSRKRKDLIATADAQFGLITARQLAELGVNTGTTSRRTTGRMWTRVLPGVHLVDGGEPTRLQREFAALLYAGEPSALTGITALRRLGIRALRLQEQRDDEAERPEPVHILIPHERRRLSTGYVRVERTHRFPEEPLRKNGLSLAPAPRAVGDAARRLRRESDVRALVAEVAQRRLVTIGQLEEELTAGPRRGSGLLRGAITGVGGGALSVAEIDLAELMSTAGIPNVRYNVALTTASGEFIAIPDAWLDDVGLAIEVDSHAHHAIGHDFERTIRRNARYAAVGVAVDTVLPTDVLRRPGAVLHSIVSARNKAMLRPRPQVAISSQTPLSAGREGWRWGA